MKLSLTLKLTPAKRTSLPPAGKRSIEEGTPARCLLPGHDQVGCECDNPFNCT